MQAKAGNALDWSTDFACSIALMAAVALLTTAPKLCRHLRALCSDLEVNRDLPPPDSAIRQRIRPVLIENRSFPKLAASVGLGSIGARRFVNPFGVICQPRR